MFNFRIIDMPDGNQIIDPSFKTPYSALTAVEMVEYTEMEKRLEYMDRQMKKERKKRERKRKNFVNLLYRLVGVFGR